jgi:predicted trehalose synthase
MRSRIITSFESEQRTRVHPSMRAHHPVRDLAGLQELDQVGA